MFLGVDSFSILSNPGSFQEPAFLEGSLERMGEVPLECSAPFVASEFSNSQVGGIHHEMLIRLNGPAD